MSEYFYDTVEECNGLQYVHKGRLTRTKKYPEFFNFDYTVKVNGMSYAFGSFPAPKSELTDDEMKRALWRK